MSRDDRTDADRRAEVWRGFVQAAIVCLAALAIIVALWLIARHAPSAGGVPLATVAPTPVLPTIRFDVTAFPTAPNPPRPTPTPSADVSDATDAGG